MRNKIQRDVRFAKAEHFSSKIEEHKRNMTQKNFGNS